jgi:hypothetical protein
MAARKTPQNRQGRRSGRPARALGEMDGGIDPGFGIDPAIHPAGNRNRWCGRTGKPAIKETANDQSTC